jgi:hypothetical protein
MAAINMNSVNTVLNSGNFIGAFNGVTGSLLLGLASILLSLCIALDPVPGEASCRRRRWANHDRSDQHNDIAGRGGFVFKGGGGGK